MGTNYVWRDRPCSTCDRYDEIHVCKSGHTWRAYPHRLFNEAHPDWGFDPASPFGFPVLSIVDWRTVFTTRPGTLWNEYGEQIPDPVAWLDAIRPLNDEVKERYCGWYARDLADGIDWFDPAGYFFHTGEFC